MKHFTLWKSFLLLCAMVVGSNVSWAQSEPSLSDFTWSTPIIDEDFSEVAKVSATATAASLTNVTKHGAFNGLYNNKTANSYGIEDEAFGSNALFLKSGDTTSPIVVGISNKTFANAGAFSFTCLKTNNGYIGMSGDGISGTAYIKAKASCYLSMNNGALTISNGTSWKSVTTCTTDVVNICVIYNNSDDDLSYGNGIAIAKQTAHVYVNGVLVEEDDEPKAMAIAKSDIASFRIVTCQKNATMNIDNVKIYDELPSYKVSASFAANKEWITITSPYALDFSSDIDGLEGAYTITSHSAGATTLTATKMTGTVKAGTGLLLHAAAVDTEDAQVIAIPVAASGDEQTDNMLVGVTAATTVNPTDGTKTNLGLKNGSFVPYSAAGTLAAGKAYLQIPTADMPSNGSKLTIIFDDDETTEINNIEEQGARNKEHEGTYNLAGQKVSESYKGIVIVNGKKYIRK